MFAPVLVGALLLTLFTLVAFVPLRVGTCFTYHDGSGELSVLFALARFSPLRIRVATHSMSFGSGGVKAAATVGTKEHQQEMADTITPEKTVEEAKVPESRLHMFLSVVDILQALFLGAKTSDNRGRALGSPLINLMVGPFVTFGKYFCKFEFTWKTSLGSSDPVVTALSTGFLWGVKSNFIAVLATRYRLLQPPEIDVKPVFDVSRFNTEVRCIFHLSVGEIMWRTVRDAAQRWQWKGAGTYGG